MGKELIDLLENWRKKYMKYSVDIDSSINPLSYCLNKVNDEIEDIWDWNIRINASAVDYGIYFNFDVDNKILEICNEPACDDCTSLDDIIEKKTYKAKQVQKKDGKKR